MGLDVRKQLLKVAGRTIVEHSAAALHDCDEVDQIVVVMTPDFVPEVQTLLVRADLPEVTRVLPGGADCDASTRAALALEAGATASAPTSIGAPSQEAGRHAAPGAHLTPL